MTYRREPFAPKEPLRVCGTAQAVLLAGVVLVFQPGAHDQFSLPKTSILLAGVPLFAAVLLATCRIQAAEQARRWDRTLLLLIVLFAAWSTAAPLWGAANRELHLIHALQRFVLCGLALCAAAAARRRARTAPRDLLGLGLPAVAVAVLAVLQGTGVDPFATLFHLQSARGGRWRVLTTLGNPGWTAELLAVCLPLVVGAARTEAGRAARRRLVAAVATALVTGAIALTGSRTGLLAAALGVGVGLAMAARGPWRRGAARASVIGLAVLLVGVVLGGLAGVSRWTEAAPVTGRAALWGAGGELTLDRPVAGWGLGHTRVELPRGLKTVVDRTPPDLQRWLPTTLVDRFDNDWLQAAVEGGLPAAALLLAIWARAVWIWARRAQRGRHRDAAFAAASLVALGACSLVSAPLHTPATAALFWILAGAAAGSGAVEPTRTVRGAGARWAWVGLLLMGGLSTAGLMLSARLLPANAEAGRGRALLREGRAAEAVAPLELGARTIPWVGGVHADLADAYNEAGRHADALAVTLRGERWSASERLWAARVDALSALGHEKEARLVLRQALGVLPGSKVLADARSVLR